MEATSVAPGIEIRSLRMEIPDLVFPLDMRTGIPPYATTRGLLDEIELWVDWSIASIGVVIDPRTAVIDGGRIRARCKPTLHPADPPPVQWARLEKDEMVLRPARWATTIHFVSRGWKAPNTSDFEIVELHCDADRWVLRGRRRPNGDCLPWPITMPPEQSDVQSFRAEFQRAEKNPPALADLDDSTLDRLLHRRSAARRAPTSIAEDLAAMDAAIAQARQADDLDALSSALETRLQASDGAGELRAAMCFELGELLYFDLEESERALRWLQEVRELDPDGYGARPGVLNAIEAIHEETGSIDGQIEILRARLEQAQSDDLRDTHRLLIANLLWECGDTDASRTELDPILTRDPSHEAAHRLLADIAADEGNWELVAEHLQIALTVAGDGLDVVELRKRLGTVLLDRLARPDDAMTHLLEARAAAPHDSTTTHAIRRCLRALGAWTDLIADLRAELGLFSSLLADNEPIVAHWLAAMSVDEVPQALRVPASHVLADIARVLQDDLNDERTARLAWDLVIELWPEHAEAVERRIDLDHKLEHHGNET